MSKSLLKDGLGWGFLLWLIGYLLGIVLFMVVPSSLIGWILTPIGTVITIVVLYKIKAASFKYYIILAIVWTLIAIVCDYFFLVKLFNPADGYYKFDVYVYYGLTLSLPLLLGWRRDKSNRQT